MISQFEAEADDDEIDPPSGTVGGPGDPHSLAVQIYQQQPKDATSQELVRKIRDPKLVEGFETSLSQLFNCMKLAYR